MKAFQNVLNYVIKLQGIEVTIRDMSDLTDHVVAAAQSNYFRKPLLDENIVSSSRSYVISEKDLTFIPKRGDRVSMSPTEYYSISQVDEMRAMKNIIGYRLFLE